MRLYRASFVAGFAAGFVAGARSGRETYDQIVKYAQTALEHPAVQQAIAALEAQRTLLGDAVHPMPPGGLGANLALRDARLLTELLVSGGGLAVTGLDWAPVLRVALENARRGPRPRGSPPETNRGS